MPEQNLVLLEGIQQNPAPNNVYLVSMQKLSGMQRKKIMTHNQKKI